MEIIIASISGILLAVAVGALVYWLMRQQLIHVRQQLTTAEQTLNEEQTKVQEAKLLLSQKELELKYEKEKNEATRQQADEKLAEQIKFLQAELTNTTQKLLDIRSEKLEQTNRTQMSSIIDPLKETISKLEKEMKDTQTQHGNTTTRLEQSIKNLVEKTESIGNRADRLVETLLYQPKSQGDWGELVVKEMLESQGLKEGIHYVYQPTLRDEKGQTLRNEETNKIMRPDFILHLDDKEDVIIDSKMTITSYDNYVHAKTDDERELYAKEILTSIHNHINELRRTNYAAYIENGRKSADFVFMFIPNEGAMQVAMAHEKNLWRDTFLKDRIFIVSEMNLYAALRIVNVTWRQIEQNKSYAKVFQTVGLLLDRLNGFIEKFGKVEKSLQQATKAYEEANHQLMIGSRSVLDTGYRLRDMGVKTKKALPESYIDESSNDDIA
ncbi:MAG: DNA recombination protein RmuC [Paludibacteraceae bacterium]|nr:DNA recombination protein RmuC [Paludibacteraceae bacterium]